MADVSALLAEAQACGLSSCDAVRLIGRAVEIGTHAAEFRRNQKVGHIVAQASAEAQRPLDADQAQRAVLIAALNGELREGADDVGC
jgi:hypothetical protein